ILSLDDALDVLDEPLGIIVENAENDWKFLLGCMPERVRKKILEMDKNRWLKPLHGGGSDIKKQIISRSKKEQERFRTFAFFDSDRRHPDELDLSWYGWLFVYQTGV
ncbi:hypothetical protein ACQZV8_20365, partial [Magnetococcales bacterium HHB-1]